MAQTQPVVLHLGDPIKYNTELYETLFDGFTIIRPSQEERERETFKRALQDRRWGDFHAMMRPQMFSGSEMGPWDEELIQLLPSSMRVYASAGAGYDTVNITALAQRGESSSDFFISSPLCVES
jgi:hypothetical protein